MNRGVTSTIWPGLSSGDFLGGSGAPSVSPKAPRASSDMESDQNRKWTQFHFIYNKNMLTGQKY